MFWTFRLRRGLIVAACILAAIVALSLQYQHTLPTGARGPTAGRQEKSDELLVHVIAVGDGTAVLVEAGGRTALIDAGSIFAAETVVEYLRSRGIRQLDYFILTYPAPERAGGMLLLLHKLSLHTYVRPPVDGTNWVYRRLHALIKDTTAVEVVQPERTLSLQLDDETLLSPLGPYEEVFTEGKFAPQDQSLAWLITRGNVRFLVASDLTSAGERLLVRMIDDLRADVLVAANHGSRASTSTVFLEAVAPRLAVISSAGPAGHLSQQVLERLNARDIQILRTDQLGHIQFQSDGRRLSWTAQDPQ
jgi:competence protein ComEC